MRRTTPSPDGRRGFVLLVVLVVVALLALTCYEFADRTVNDRLAVARKTQLAQARAAALSGVDYVLAMASDPEFDPLLAMAEPEQFVGVPVTEDGRVAFTVFDPAYPSDADFAVNGLGSELGKINLNALAESDLDEADAREMLINVPGFDESIADTVLDFIDADAEPRPFGTETDDDGVPVRNLPLDSLDDLLALPEIDATLLYGEDANRNGVLDPSENDGDASAPPDNADGYLDPGLQRWVTVYGREASVTPDGWPRINVNADDVDTMAADVSQEFGEAMGQYMLAVRNMGQQQGGSGGGGQQQQQQPGSPEELGRQIATDILFGPEQTDPLEGSYYTGGEIRSLTQLIVTEVQDADGTPLPNFSTLSAEDIDRMYSVLALSDAPTIAGRIDLNAAPLEVLLGLPGFDEARAQQVFDGQGTWNSPMALFAEGAAPLELIEKIEPIVTTGTRTFRFSSVGYVEGGPMVRVDAVVDAAQWPPRILELTDLSRLGVGYDAGRVRPEVVTEE